MPLERQQLALAAARLERRRNDVAEPAAAASSRSPSPGCRRRVRASSRASLTAGTSPIRNGERGSRPPRTAQLNAARSSAEIPIAGDERPQPSELLQRVRRDGARAPVAERPRPVGDGSPCGR